MIRYFPIDRVKLQSCVSMNLPSLPKLDRRRFLKAAGVSIALPSLESFRAANAATPAKAQRLVCIGTYLGFHQSSFFPEETGKNYKPSTLLEPIA